jgi:hypothetical protein
MPVELLDPKAYSTDRSPNHTSLESKRETCFIVLPILVNTDPADETQMCFRVLCERGPRRRKDQ